MMGSKPEKPHGKDAVVQAIMEAAIPLIAERGVNAVSFRDIAAAANVNHALITRHFGNKEELMRRTGEMLGQHFLHSARQNGDALPTALSRYSLENRTNIRAIARILLDTPSMSSNPDFTVKLLDEFIRWFRDDLKVDENESRFDPNMLIFLITSFLIGSEVFGTHIQDVLHLTDDAYRNLQPRAIQMLMRNVLTMD